jgi:hypothetical protein
MSFEAFTGQGKFGHYIGIKRKGGKTVFLNCEENEIPQLIEAIQKHRVIVPRPKQPELTTKPLTETVDDAEIINWLRETYKNMKKMKEAEQK